MTHAPLTDEQLAAVLASAPVPENGDSLAARLRAWHDAEHPGVAVDGLELCGRQAKALVVDQLRLAELAELRAGDRFRLERNELYSVRTTRVAVLSGAGISVDAGFRTFRGAEGEGLWEKVDPMVLASIDGYYQDPMRSMRWYCGRRTMGLRAVPTLAHAAIAHAQESGAPWAGVHTQNVDGLHEVAGSRGVNRIHGSLWVWKELGNGRLVFDSGDDVDVVPLDRAGRPRWRPGVVMFGDHAPMGVYARAIAELAMCDVALVVGTSAQVSTLWPLLHAALQADALMVEINPEASPVTLEMKALHLPLPSGVGVPLALEALGAIAPDDTDRLARTPRTPLHGVIDSLEHEFLADA